MPIVLVIKPNTVDKEIISLFEKYVSQQCSREELEQVLLLIKNGKYEEEWNEVLTNDNYR